MNGEAPGPAARKSAEEANPASQAGKGNHGPTTTNSTVNATLLNLSFLMNVIILLNLSVWNSVKPPFLLFVAEFFYIPAMVISICGVMIY
jgi:hypothetical protein